MNSREKTFLLGGLGLGILVAVIGVGAFVWHDHEHSQASATVTTTAAAPPAGSVAANSTPSLQLSPEEVSAAGIQVATVTTARLSTDVDAFGRVEMPESQLSTISARVGGRIDELYLQYTGESIRRGQPVAAIYSPDAASSLEEYFLAKQSRQQLAGGTKEAQQQADELVSASRRRLELWGISAPPESSHHPDVHITMYSPTSGVVVERKVARGQYVNSGDTLFTVADLSTIWVKADVYESQMPMIRPGQEVEITSEALPNRTLHGRVELIEPQANSQTRTVPVHVHLANPGMKLVPGMFVRTLFISKAPAETVVIPRSAVLDTGTRTLVYVAGDSGTFEARDVELGAASGDQYPVLKGLKPGEKVVVNGNFMIDSQTRLSGGMTGMFGGSKEFQKQGTGNGAAASANGAKLSLMVDPEPPKGASDAMFHVTLTGSDGKPIPDATVTVTLVMPAMPSMSMPEMRNSFTVPWSGGMYMGKGNIPMAGSWNVTVEASRNGQPITTYRTRLNAR